MCSRAIYFWQTPPYDDQVIWRETLIHMTREKRVEAIDTLAEKKLMIWEKNLAHYKKRLGQR